MAHVEGCRISDRHAHMDTIPSFQVSIPAHQKAINLLTKIILETG